MGKIDSLKEDIQNPLVVIEMQNKIATMYHLSVAGMTAVKELRGECCCRLEVGILTYCQWECTADIKV